MNDAIREMKCNICGSTEHDACGFCSRCRDHCIFTYEEDGKTLSSECCGAAGYPYDYDPT